jgi:hypothetical protein
MVKQVGLICHGPKTIRHGLALGQQQDEVGPFRTNMRAQMTAHGPHPRGLTRPVDQSVCPTLWTWPPTHP